MRRKIKKSFSISVESDAFIRRSCKERKSTSESETLDMLLSELMAIRQQTAIEAAYSNYYDSLSDDEIAEESAWGAFAESQEAR
jgi:cytochrome c553